MATVGYGTRRPTNGHFSTWLFQSASDRLAHGWRTCLTGDSVVEMRARCRLAAYHGRALFGCSTMNGIGVDASPSARRVSAARLGNNRSQWPVAHWGRQAGRSRFTKLQPWREWRRSRGPPNLTVEPPEVLVDPLPAASKVNGKAKIQRDAGPSIEFLKARAVSACSSRRYETPRASGMGRNAWKTV